MRARKRSPKRKKEIPKTRVIDGGKETVRFNDFWPLYATLTVVDERWAEWLDSKVALLINRPNIDVVEYGGKNYDEYVPSYCVTYMV